MTTVGISKCCCRNLINRHSCIFAANRNLWKWSQNNDYRGSGIRLWYPKINTQEDASKFISSLDANGRNLLLEELHSHSLASIDISNLSSSKIELVKFNQLFKIFTVNSLPYIGFGILDNGIMILAGEYIDLTFGVMLGISTMAAAALGNLVSDLAGICTAGYIETFVEKLGFVAPRLTEAQVKYSSAKYMPFLGRFFGLALGCLLGMLPLLFFDDDKEESSKKEIGKVRDDITVDSSIKKESSVDAKINSISSNK